MEITESFVLPQDVSIIPVSELPKDVRKSIDCADDAFVVSRPGARTPSTVIDQSAAKLLQRFREPSTIVQAVILYARETCVTPDKVLEEAYPLVKRFVLNQTLVSCDNAEARAPVRPLLAARARVAGVEIVRPIVILEDTELYLARRQTGAPAVLKCARHQDSDAERLLHNEARVLERIGGLMGPRLLASGDIGDCPYLLLEHVSGVDAHQAAGELREGGGTARPDLYTLILAITHVYADLHASGVLHGDVHPRNILVDGDGRPRLIDFGLADSTDLSSPRRVGRGGVPFYMEPEYAARLAGGDLPPRATVAGEQYALGALLYELVTGVHYIDFNIERDRMLKQILDLPMKSFADRGLEQWPAVEAALGRALAKVPKERFPTVRAMAEALESASHDEGHQRSSARELSRARPSPRVRALSRGIIEELRLDGALYERGLGTAPTTSLFCGAAGVGYALYRVAVLSADAQLIADAHAWTMRAASEIGHETAFYSPENELTPATIGSASPYHSASGVHAVQALIAGAMGDVALQQAMTRAFLEASASGATGLDATVGVSSILLGTTLLLEAAQHHDCPDASSLQQRGGDLLRTLWTALDRKPRMEDADTQYLGVAHGWAGMLYATLAWCRAARVSPPAHVAARLDELARLAEPVGRGVMWPWALGGAGEYMAGWCNGTAGYVFLWTLAAEVLGDSRYTELAVRAAWNVAEASDPASTLCCGLMGRAYALLNLYKHTGEHRWLDYAKRLTERAAVQNQFPTDYPLSLYKGRLPVVLLDIELERPQESALPFFESEAGSA